MRWITRRDFQKRPMVVLSREVYESAHCSPGTPCRARIMSSSARMPGPARRRFSSYAVLKANAPAPPVNAL